MYQFASGTLAVNTPFELITPGDTSAKATRDRVFLSLSPANSLASTYGTVYARAREDINLPFPSGTVFLH